VLAIGSHCCKAIAEAGYRPICFDDLSTGNASFVQWGPLLVEEIHDGDKIAATIREYDVQAAYRDR
jgi:UDP-arabinose 4-epimerase